LALGRSKTPLVVSYHGSDSAAPVSIARRLVLRGLARRTDHIFAVSEGARQAAARIYGLPSAVISVLPNGVDSDRFAPAPREAVARRARVVIGHVGRLFPVKNQSMLIRAAADLVRRGVDLEVRIAGTGPERAALLDLAASLGVADR